MMHRIDLLVGQSAFVPDRLINELKSCSGSAACHRYTDPRGLPELRSQIAAKYEQKYGYPVDPDADVLITHGATEALWLTVSVLSQPGDHILICDPSYLGFEEIIRSLDREPVRVVGRAENGYRITPADVATAWTTRVKLLLLASPDNPTGLVYPLQELEAIHEAVSIRGGYLVCDEVYENFVYDGEHASILQLNAALRRAVVVNSFSKCFGIGGWRLGWMVAAPSVIDAALDRHQAFSMGSSTLLQKAVVPVVNDEDVAHEICLLRHALAAKRDRIVDALSTVETVSLSYGPPCGGFYFFVNVRQLAERLDLRRSPSSGEAVASLLQCRFSTIVGPGINFGQTGADSIRFSFLVPEISLLAFVRQLSALEKTCGSAARPAGSTAD